jgi:hypothetical protein
MRHPLATLRSVAAALEEPFDLGRELVRARHLLLGERGCGGARERPPRRRPPRPERPPREVVGAWASRSASLLGVVEPLELADVLADLLGGGRGDVELRAVLGDGLVEAREVDRGAEVRREPLEQRPCRLGVGAGDVVRDPDPQPERRQPRRRAGSPRARPGTRRGPRPARGVPEPFEQSGSLRCRSSGPAACGGSGRGRCRDRRSGRADRRASSTRSRRSSASCRSGSAPLTSSSVGPDGGSTTSTTSSGHCGSPRIPRSIASCGRRSR